MLYKWLLNIFVGYFHCGSGENIERTVEPCSSTKCGKLDHSPLPELLNKYTCYSPRERCCMRVGQSVVAGS